MATLAGVEMGPGSKCLKISPRYRITLAASRVGLPLWKITIIIPLVDVRRGLRPHDNYAMPDKRRKMTFIGYYLRRGAFCARSPRSLTARTHLHLFTLI